MDVKVLGPGCRNCQTTADLITAKAAELGLPITLEKVTEYQEIARLGVMKTPGVIVDGRIVHSGGVPRPEAIEGWLKEAGTKPGNA